MDVLEIFIITLLGATSAIESEYTPVVQTRNGPVRGKILTTVSKELQFSAFKGIRYAEPPIGHRRFKPPIEIKKWADVFNATEDGSSCLQVDRKTFNLLGSEDCLFINVYTPHMQFNNLKYNDLKSVMFWIHGGGFFEGSSNSSLYGPDFLIEDDVILVTSNYRLGALGLLNLNHENATGNVALKDQNLALKWVNKNIVKFGGDPKKVTIFGQSAGGTSVDLHALSNMSRGLFFRSIAMSGSSLWDMQSNRGSYSAAFELGLRLGISANNKDELLEALYTTAAENIVLKSNEIFQIPFRPVIESPEIASKGEKFLTSDVIDKYRLGIYYKHSHMTGITTNEARSINESQLYNDIITHRYLLTTATLEEDNRLLRQYETAGGFTNLPIQDIKNLLSLASDFFFTLRVDSKQKLMEKHNKYPIYYYRFGFDSGPYWITSNNYNFSGIGHAEDLAYLFYFPAGKIPLDDPVVKSVKDKYVRLITNFAKYGNPTPKGKEDPLIGIIWPNSGINGWHIEINKNLTIGPRPMNSRVKYYQAAGIDLTNYLS